MTGRRDAADRRPARRSVGRARRLGRVGHRDRMPRSPTPAMPSSRSSSTSTAAGGGCRPTTAGGSSGRDLRRPGRARRDRPRDARRRASTALALREPAPVVVHRAARPVRRGRHDPGGPRGGRPRVHRFGRGRVGARDGQGALQADVPRARACRSWTGARSAPTAGRPTATASPASSSAFAAGAGDPRLMVKPARLGSSVGMTLVHDAGRAAAAALDLAFRYDTLALVETYLPGARDLEVSIIGNDPAALEVFGPGEIISGHEFYDYAAKYTPGLSETSTRAEVPDRDAARPAQARARRLPRHRRRGLRPVDFLRRRRADRPVRDQHDPGLHPDQPVPDDAGRGRLTFIDVCEPDHRSRARAARRPADCPPDARPTCRDDASAGRPSPGLAARARPAARRDVPVRAAHVARSVAHRLAWPGPGRVPRSRCSCAAAALYGVGELGRVRVPRTSRSTGAVDHAEARPSTPPSSCAAAQNLFELRTGPLEDAAPCPADRGRGRPSRSGCPARSSSSSRSARRSSSGGSASDASSSTPRASLRRGRRRSPAGAAAAADHRRSARPRRPAWRSASDLDPVDLDAATRLALARARPTSAARRRAARRQRHRRERLPRAVPSRAAGSRSSASTRPACARPSSSRARCGCCAACSSGASR